MLHARAWVRPRSLVAGALAAVTVLFVAAPSALAAPRRPPPPRPNLELTTATVTPRVVFHSEPKAQVRVCVGVRNTGKRRSGRIVATLKLEARGTSVVLATRSLAPLAAPTRPRRGAPLEFDSARGCEQGDASPVLLPLGVYDISVCVSERSGRERRLADNCRGRSKYVFLVKRTWSANLSGQSGAGVLDLGFEKWQSNAMVFTFDPAQQIVAKGVFGYRISAGSVTYIDQESATGCERFGTLTDFGPTGRLTLFYLQETYEAVGRVREGFRYPITNVCNDDLGARWRRSSSTPASGSRPSASRSGRPSWPGRAGGPRTIRTSSGRSAEARSLARRRPVGGPDAGILRLPGS